MTRFIETAEDDLGTAKVALSLRRSPEGAVLGRIVAMAVTHAGLTPETTAPDDPPIAEALAKAVELAGSIGGDVAVVDPEGLWDPTWGVLETDRPHHEPAKPSEGDEVVAASEPPPVTDRKAEDLPNLGGVID